MVQFNRQKIYEIIIWSEGAEKHVLSFLDGWFINSTALSRRQFNRMKHKRWKCLYWHPAVLLLEECPNETDV